MTSNDDIPEELPEELRAPLKRFRASRSSDDLVELIRIALKDFAPEDVPEALPDSMNFMDDLGLDSLAITEFAFFFEDALDIKITNAELVGLRTIGDLKQYLLEKLP